MLARVHSSGIIGIEGFPVEVEVDSQPGLERLTVVGLPDATVRESAERVRSALGNSGFRMPSGLVVVNLAPADMRKEGVALDLPIAIGMVLTEHQLEGNRFEEYAIVGELALDGSVRPVAGALSMAVCARNQRLTGIIVPHANAEEAGVVQGIDVIPVTSLRETVGFLAGNVRLNPYVTDTARLFEQKRHAGPDLQDVRGQAHVKRAMTIAAAGAHNLLMIGPPGTGKTMLASRLPGILPDMTFDEALETTQVYSVASQNGRDPLIVQRPFRAPHHTATTVSIAGGGQGQQPVPGEVSMAHNGVLFLDELPEFNRSAIEVLRQPLEEGLVHIRRANYAVTYPSRFMLVVAMNPCPCGHLTDPNRACSCSPGQVQRYMGRISGPLLDRIDLHVDVPALSFEELRDERPSGPSSAEVRARVQTTRNRQRQRQSRDGTPVYNAHLDGQAIRKRCVLDDQSAALLRQAMDTMGFSARAHDKVLRVARTIADLEDADAISAAHVAEAIQYRSLDRQTP